MRPELDLDTRVLNGVVNNQHRTVRDGLYTTRLLGLPSLHGVEQGDVLAALDRLRDQGRITIKGSDLNRQRIHLVPGPARPARLDGPTADRVLSSYQDDGYDLTTED
ncbi:hypothetical protein ACFV10_10415 [Streptomyces cyaneofuscatus]|uniref:hypothetical protein n=1 Tax=Streptomyces cyaneofuscatus TaxID=66883 RepID=UPI00367A87D1